MTGKFSASVPRVMQWGDVQKARDTWVCPECGESLEKDQQTYVLGVRADGKTQAAMVSNQGGYFCAECPVVVLDRTVFGQYAVKAFPKVEDVSTFTVAGIVNRETADGKPALVAFADPAELTSADDEVNEEPVAEKDEAEVPAADKTEVQEDVIPEPASAPEVVAEPEPTPDPTPEPTPEKTTPTPEPVKPSAPVPDERSFAPVREEQVKSSHRAKKRKKLRKRR